MEARRDSRGERSPWLPLETRPDSPGEPGMRGLEGVPGLPGAPQDEAGLTSLIFIQASAVAAAKSLQSCPTLCDPIDSSPPGSSVHGILQARILEWVARFPGALPQRRVMWTFPGSHTCWPVGAKGASRPGAMWWRSWACGAPGKQAGLKQLPQHLLGRPD